MQLLVFILVCLGLIIPKTLAFMKNHHFQSKLNLINPKTKVMNLYLSETDDSKKITFANYVVYKGKGAVAVKIIPPTYQVSTKTKVVTREGVLLLEFALIGSQPREYDWTKKGTFSLDVNECGDMLSMDYAKGVEFVHDPNMGNEKQGQVTKRLKLVPTADGKGFFFSLNVNDKAIGPINYSIPITKGEYEIVRQIMIFAIPRFLGFDEVWNNPGSNEFTNEPFSIPVPPPAPVWKRLED